MAIPIGTLEMKNILCQLKRALILPCTLSLMMPITLWANMIEGSKKEITNVEIWENGRPANFYKTALDLNPQICETILTALNKPIKVEHARFTWGNYLMQSELSVPWEDLTGQPWKANRVGRAIVDLDHDGVKEEIYVRISSQHNVINHVIYRKNESFLEAEFDAFRDLRGEDISNLTSHYGIADSKGLTRAPFDVEGLTDHFESKSNLEQYVKQIKKILNFGSWVDVIRLKQNENNIAKDYLLKSSNRFAGRNRDGSIFSTIPSVFVIDVQQDGAQLLQCHFESNYIEIP